MNSNRIEELQKQTAYPESTSVQQALLQVWNEMQQDFNSRICKNCSYLQRDFNNTCELGISIPEDENGFTDTTFGCNNFQDLI